MRRHHGSRDENNGQHTRCSQRRLVDVACSAALDSGRTTVVPEVLGGGRRCWRVGEVCEAVTGGGGWVGEGGAASV